MKITLIEKEKTWHGEQLIKQGKEMNIEVERMNIHNLIEMSNLENKMGDIVFWRASSLSIEKERVIFLNFLKKRKKIIINDSLLKYSNLAEKLFQQEHVKDNLKNVNTIPTYSLKNKKELLELVKRRKISFPFIVKPNLGARGEGILLIKNEIELNRLSQEIIRNSVFQNYIENDGDYRVLMLGGYPLGIIKRTAERGNFLNNVSKGGEPNEVEDEELKEELYKIAVKITALFSLKFCGVDIIYNSADKKFYFLELNTVPQWEGFQKETKINVAEKILEYCKAMKSDSSLCILIEEYYSKNLTNTEKKFHFLSRMFLWTGEEKYFEGLKKLEKFFIGLDKKGHENKIKEILENKEYFKKKVYNNRPFRRKVVKKYPLLGSYHEILFRNLMSKNIFKKDLGEYIEPVIGSEEFKKVKDELIENKNDILKLSTFAVNFLYFSRDYLNEEGSVLEKVMLDLANQLEDDIKKVSNNLYFLTHCIIGESRFYSKKVSHDKLKTYLFFLEKAEKLAINNYFEVSLDNKLEFLVCCKLLDYKSKLAPIIQNEACHSLSELGNFLVDKQSPRNNNDFFSSEHRSVLYILSKLKK